MGLPPDDNLWCVFLLPSLLLCESLVIATELEVPAMETSPKVVGWER